ncbi:MAG: cadmium-translocating P-type ATPase [Ruminococcus sp.]|nr:cadmium-translocating P-type ATPase [Candidatus Copronaster equi]
MNKIKELFEDNRFLIAAAVLVVLSFIPMPIWLKIVFEIIAVIISVVPVGISSIDNIKAHKITEIELMLIASIAACIIGDFREAAVVLILYRFGELLEDRAVDESRKSIDAVAGIQQDFAHIITEENTTETVEAKNVKAGTKISVLPHERFPIDGLLYSQSATVDASAITGESIPVTLNRGKEVKSGMMNGENAVTVVTTAEFENSTASRIVKMVEEAAENKGKTQKLITRIARYYTPVVAGLAVVIAVIGSIASGNVTDWIYRALIFLVASCPCALVISVPLGLYTGIGASAKSGIITKGSVFIEAAAKAKTFVFDKTGTLTTGDFEIKKIYPEGNFTEEQVALFAAIAEHFSSHPLAKCIVNSAPEIDETMLSDFTEIAGKGACVTLGEKKVFCGSKKFMLDNNVDFHCEDEKGIFVAYGNVPVGRIILRSTVRNGVVKMIENLKNQGVEKIIMLTGDNRNSAEEIAEICKIDEFYCDLLPEEKLNMLRDIKAKNGQVVFVGDGINDAPVLAAADAGISMGLGTQAANEASDIIITNDNIEKLSYAHLIYKRTMNIVKFNIGFALAVKLVVLVTGAMGLAPMWLAVFADVGVTIICILLSMLIKSKKLLIFDR